MECADEDTLGALIANALDAAERRAIAVHAATCEHCHALLEGLLEVQPDAAPDAELKLGPGTLVGRYVIGDQLGAGGMGVVYAAVDSELQRKVAVKLLRPEGGGQLGTQGRERLMREARMLASLSHPNVVTVFDVGTHDGSLFLAMELVEGGSLNAWMRRAPRTTEEIVDRLIEAGRGLSAAHATGVVHRDVKPDNILVGRDGHARVTDFGLARFDRAPAEPEPSSGLSPAASPDLTRTGTLMGTPVYMAPEQMVSGDAEPRTDQWSFCAMVYEVIAGVRPFSVENLEARSAAITEGRLAAPAKGRRVPGWLARIVARGLRANPAERWPSMDAVVAALVRGRRRRGRIVRWAAIAGALAIASGASIALAVRGGPARKLEMLRNTDPRPGCNCPMSACEDHCVSVCSARNYRMGAPVPGVSQPDRQEALLGVSGDGSAMLFLADKGCMLDHLWLAHRDGETYQSVDITDQLDRQRVMFAEGCCTLAADGKSMVLSRSDRHGFVRVRLAGSTPIPVDASDDLGDLVPGASPAVSAQFPVLSADGHTLYYRVIDGSVAAGDLGPLDGVYAAVRADPDAAFAPGTRLPGRARYYDAVTGISSDHLSLFMTSEYRTHVLVRSSVDQPFGMPADNMIPAEMQGFRTVPLADCQRLLTTSTVGGCRGEDIVWLEAVH